jgi:hypothetical protein
MVEDLQPVRRDAFPEVLGDMAMGGRGPRLGLCCPRWLSPPSRWRTRHGSAASVALASLLLRLSGSSGSLAPLGCSLSNPRGHCRRCSWQLHEGRQPNGAHPRLATPND